ncbi:hypothetical protein Q8A73_016355 [Channa argus]|nr:hypothetical protein Q8A73_016355 [Channa argus]
MGLGLLLWASLICLMRFNGCAGFPAPKGNMYDDAQLSYIEASVAEQPEVVPAEPLLPNKPHAPEVNWVLNDEPIDWAPEEFDNFPLSSEHLSDQAMSQADSIPRESTSLEVAPSNSMPHSLRNADRSTSAYYGPYTAYASQDDSWLPEPVSSGSGVVDLDVGFPDTGSSAAGGDWHNHHLVFEEVFHYPSENTGPSHLDYGTVDNTAKGLSQADYMSNLFSTKYAFKLDDRSMPSYPVKEGDQPVSALMMQSSFPSSFSGEENPNYQPLNAKISFRLEETPDVNAHKVYQREAKQILHPAQSYIQLRDGYQQGRYLSKKSWRSSELPPQVLASSESVKGDDVLQKS